MTNSLDSVLKVNQLKNCYVTDGNIWTIDETIFNENIYTFLVINIKTRTILGYVIGHQKVSGDSIVELYKKILENYLFKDQGPFIVHSDSESEYTTPEILEFFKNEKIKISISIADQHQNQVSESVNNSIKYYTVLNLLEDGQNSTELRKLISQQLDKFKYKSKKIKARDKGFRQWFFNTEYFGKIFKRRLKPTISNILLKGLLEEKLNIIIQKLLLLKMFCY